MCFYLKIEDVVANYLINLFDEEKNNRFLSYREIEEYGNEVVRHLNEKGEPAVIIWSRAHTIAMLCDYSDLFEEKEIGGELGIYLRQDKGIADLMKKFSGYIPAMVLLAFFECASEKKGAAG